MGCLKALPTIGFTGRIDGLTDGLGAGAPTSDPRPLTSRRTMAHKKGQGSSRNGRDSNAQRRGVKKFGGERVSAGNILIRQVGNRYHPGTGVGQGNDYTLFALVEGQVKFDRKGRRINVVPAG